MWRCFWHSADSCVMCVFSRFFGIVIRIGRFNGFCSNSLAADDRWRFDCIRFTMPQQTSKSIAHLDKSSVPYVSIALVSVSVLATQLRQPNCTGMLSSIHSFFRSFLFCGNRVFSSNGFFLFPYEIFRRAFFNQYQLHITFDTTRWIRAPSYQKKKKQYCQTTIAGRDRKC